MTGLATTLLLLLLCSISGCAVSPERGALDAASSMTFNQAVLQADRGRSATLLLGEDTWYTDGAKNKRISLRSPSLHIAGSGPEKTIIRRPDHSLGEGKGKDFYYGAFFEPAPPSDEQLHTADWKEWTTDDGSTFLYAVLQRGQLTLSDLTLDCNMHRQLVEKGDKVEHSAMLGFAGSRTQIKEGPYKGRIVFVAFDSVVVRNVRLLNEGFSDAIWISRGYFQPNIGNIVLDSIRTGSRHNGKRSSITFSAPAQKVRVTDCNVYRFELEESNATGFSNAPRLTPLPRKSNWHISNSTFEILDIAAKGNSTLLDVSNVEVLKKTLLYQVGGQISNSTLHKEKDPRLFRLQDLRFVDVRWVFHADESGRVRGLKLTPLFGETFVASFVRNSFHVEGNVTKGTLIDSELSKNKNQVIDVTFVDCTFDSRFGRSGDLVAIRAREKGTWTVERNEGNSRPLLVQKGSNPGVVVEIKE